MKKTAFILIVFLLASSCRLSDESILHDGKPVIFPDYTDISVPVNIAPLNFKCSGARGMSLSIRGGDSEYNFHSWGDEIHFPMNKWRKMLSFNQGDTLFLTLRIHRDGSCLEFEPFYWEVRPEKIDRYVSYRLIEPAYEMWNVLSIEERCTESFRERTLAHNRVTDRSCMNCHTSNRAAVPTTFLHARSKGGATLYQREGQIRKINTATDSTAGAAVYGEISKDGRYGIFTTADIRNGLHSAALERFEVFDASSDLILCDFVNNTVSDSPLVRGPEFQETFPCWSADCRTVYFCRAEALEQPARTKEMHYNLYSIDFDTAAGRLGSDLKLVYDAAAEGKSVSFPKCSPDGRKILFCASDYGTFPIWHVETELWMLDVESGGIDTLPETNGLFSDSYHSWSTDGRWICWASKRDDRVYGKPYFAFVREDGSVAKGFALPQKSPERYLTSFKSYNIPELYNDAEPYGLWDVRKFYLDTPTENMTYLR